MQFAKLVVATKNLGKLREFQAMLGGVAEQVHALPANVAMPAETGTTFMENALLKARAVSGHTGLPALADDSGLVVDALDGAPGVYSARYGGATLADEQRIHLLLERMEGVPWEARTAKFVAALALVTPSGEAYTALGECHGMISLKPAGTQGFGYDPIFYYPPLAKSFAELEFAEKNAVSHRTDAILKLIAMLKDT